MLLACASSAAMNLLSAVPYLDYMSGVRSLGYETVTTCIVALVTCRCITTMYELKSILGTHS